MNTKHQGTNTNANRTNSTFLFIHNFIASCVNLTVWALELPDSSYVFHRGGIFRKLTHLIKFKVNCEWFERNLLSTYKNVNNNKRGNLLKI